MRGKKQRERVNNRRKRERIVSDEKEGYALYLVSLSAPHDAALGFVFSLSLHLFSSQASTTLLSLSLSLEDCATEA